MNILYKGNRPTGGKLLTKLHPWRIFHLPKRSTAEWLNLKVALAAGYEKEKANFYLAWNGRRWAKTKDLVLLKEREPEFFTKLDAFMTKHHNSTVSADSGARRAGRPRTVGAPRPHRRATGRGGSITP